MFLKVKSTILFVSVLSISCLTLNFLGIYAAVNAQESQPPQAKECPSSQSGKPSGKASSGCETQCCCEQAKECSHGSKCDSKQGCNTPCEKKSGCDQGETHCVSDMIAVVRCAKKELLKEKIKAKLEKKVGLKLDKAADLLIDAMLEECKAGMQNKERRAELERNLCEIFSSKDSK